MLKQGQIPLNLKKLGLRQSQMLQVICARGGATVREIHAAIDDPPGSYCGLRTLLNRLVRKGLLKARPSGRHSEVLYLPAESWAELQQTALERIAQEHFEGSTLRAVRELMKLAANESGRRLDRPGRAA